MLSNAGQSPKSEQYTFTAPQSGACTFTKGFYQFTGDINQTLPTLSIPISSSSCTSSTQCSAFDSACKTGVCASGNCSAQNKADGTACTGGTCQAGACQSSKTCAELLGTQCSSGQQCTGGTMTSSSDVANLCCVGGTCEDTPTADTSCEKNLNCEFWEQCDEAKTSCEMATWVYLVGAFMGMILLMNSLK